MWPDQINRAPTEAKELPNARSRQIATSPDPVAILLASRATYPGRTVTDVLSASDWVDALRRSHDHLVSLMDTLPPDLVTGPSYCQEWTVAQVLSHLGSGAEIFSLFLAAGVAGTEPPGRESFPAIWDAWNGRSPERQFVDSRTANAALVEQFEGLGEPELSELRIPLFGMDLDPAGLARMRLSEHAIHAWDVAVVVDPAATVLPAATRLLVDTVGQMAGRLGRPAAEPNLVQVVTHHPDRRLLLSTADPVEISAEDGAQATATIEMPAESFIRLVYGRLDAGHTPPEVIAGDVDLDGLRASFPGI
jgi:uncharacterized protein (TIGR03083 family)